MPVALPLGVDLEEHDVRVHAVEGDADAGPEDDLQAGKDEALQGTSTPLHRTGGTIRRAFMS